jgi:Zn-dependent protease with chaperone function
MPHNYEALVARLTEYARLHPRMYRARVAGLAMLGYAYLFGALILLAAVIAGAVWVILHNVGAWMVLKLAIPVVVLTWMIGRALWVRFTPPKGLELRPGEAPALTAEIERVRTAMKAPRVHTMLITDEHNAGVYQYPRLGVFGGYRTYLLLGLPYMASMPLDEYRAVLAHEFGHVSRAHGRFGAWIARVHNTWLRLMEELDRKNHWAHALFSRFFHWYGPYFEAYTAVLRRANEFEADRVAEAVSPGATAASLCRGQVTGRWVQREFWPGVFAGTLREMEPPRGVHADLVRGVRTAHEHAQAQAWLDEALAETTFVHDTHPALRERLQALGMEPAVPAPFEESAADALLGSRVRPLADRLTHEWRAAIGPYWLDQHRRATETAVQLAELEAKAEPLSSDDERERVWLTAELHGDTVAVPLARALVGTEHEDASIHYLLGRALVNDKDEAAFPHLERAISLDVQFTPVACRAAAALSYALGREDDCAAYEQRIRAYHHAVEGAREERGLQALSPGDRFLPHGLDEPALAELREQLAESSIAAAYVVRKQVHHFPDQPCFVVALEPKSLRVGLPGESQRLVQAVAARISLPGTCMVITLESTQRRLAKPIRAVAGAEVYRAGAVSPRPLPVPAA